MRNPAIALLAFVFAITVVAAPTASAKKPPHSSKSEMCRLPVTRDRAVCLSSYGVCLASAKSKVQSYYLGKTTATLDTIAARWAKDAYGSRGFTWQAGMTGCLAALMDEYRLLYG
jgi:hypothetical protein